MPMRNADTNRWFIAATVVTAGTLVALVLRFGIGPQLPAFWYLAAVGVPLAFIDARDRRLPNVLTLPSYPAAFLLLGAAAAVVPGGPSRLVHAVIGMAAAVLFFAVLLLLSPSGLGLGDAKLAGVLGAYLGWLGFAALAAGLLAGWLLAAAAALGLVAAGRAGRGTQIPLGPFLIAGALAVVLASRFLPALAR